MGYRYAEGVKIRFGLDLFPGPGFTDQELTDKYYSLTSDKEQENLICEAATFEEIDSLYNPGEMILEAITVKAFSQTPKRMAALARALNKHMEGDGISVLEPIIGKPKKSGMFSTVTVQLPLSDGQSIFIVFHSPDNDAKKIAADDEIIAFRWILNKRDITQAVSPEYGQEVPLNDISKRLGKLTTKNSEKFQKQQAKIQEQKGELETLKANTEEAEKANSELMNTLTDSQEKAEDQELTIKNLTKRIEKAKEENEGLQREYEGLIAMAAEKEKREQDERDRQAEEESRLQKLGTEKVPGVRLQEAGEAGKMWEMLQKAEISQAEWDSYVADLYQSGKATRPVEPETTKPETGERLNGYIAFYKGKQTEVWADSSHEAQIKAAKFFKAKKEYEVTVKLAVKGSDPAIIAEIDSEMKKRGFTKQPQPEGMSTGVPIKHHYYDINDSKGRDLAHIAVDIDDEKGAYAVHAEGLQMYPHDGTTLKANKAEELPEKLKKVLAAFDEWKATEEGKEIEPEPEPITTEPETTNEPEPEPEEEGSEEPEAVQMLRKIIDGDLDDDPDAIDKALDRAAEDLEEAGLIDQYDDLLNEAADHYTEVLERYSEAA